MSRAQLTLSKSSTRTERGGSENSCGRTKSKQGGGGARSVGDEEERQLDDSLRPRSLAEFIGQQRIKQVLGMSIEAAQTRRATRPTLFSAPPGFGKTSLAHIIAREL